MTEEWRDIPGWPGYQASSEGRLRTLKRRVPSILTGTPGAWGHRSVQRNRAAECRWGPDDVAKQRARRAAARQARSVA